MKSLTKLIVLLITFQLSVGFTFHRHSESYESGSSRSYDNTQGTESSHQIATSNTACCTLSSWAYKNYGDVREFASRLRQEYNSMLSGSTGGSSINYKPWAESILVLTGKTSGELDALCRSLAELLISEIRSGITTYQTIAQSNFFEWQAMKALEALSKRNAQTQYPYNQYPNNLRRYNSQRHQLDDDTGNIYNFGEGSYYHPYVSGYNVNNPYLQQFETNSRKKTIYDWVNDNMEPSVMNYRPVVNIHKDWASLQPTVHSSVPYYHHPSTEVEAFSGIGQKSYNQSPPSTSTVTLSRFNKTIITNPDGRNIVSGSQSHKKWIDGKLVYNAQRPFGEWSVPKDEAWKCEEREKLYWILKPNDINTQQLENWQRQQADRLEAMANKYHTSVNDIHNWHRNEMERYRVLLGQYRVQTQDDTNWKRLERGRLDWLIHQNSISPEDLDRWQRENRDRLIQLARQYRISLEELLQWQRDELERLYTYFNDQNNSMMPSNVLRPDSLTNYNSEQERLEELIKQHNATIEQLHNSIKLDQQKLRDLSTKYRGNVADMEKWLRGELTRLGGIINEQRNEVTRITAWQSSERDRLENIVKQHRGSVDDIDAQIARDRHYLEGLAAKYHVSMEELEVWQRSELERLKKEGQLEIEKGIKEWQEQERAHLKQLMANNDLTIDEFQKLIITDRQRLENLAKTYKIQVSEIEEWLHNELNSLKNDGALQTVQQELADWQKKERERLLNIVRQTEITVQELELKIQTDQSHLKDLANKYQVHVSEIENWLKNELLRLRSQGLVKTEDLQQWQKNERELILKLIQQNKLTIDELEKKLLTDRKRLNDLSRSYNVQTHDIEAWIRKESERLQSLGLLQIQNELQNWQKVEQERLLSLVKENNMSLRELEEKIKNDQVHLYSLSHQYKVKVEEVEDWIKQEIKRLQAEGLIELEKLRDWQLEWRSNLTNMVKERDFTVEEFHKWLLQDRTRLQALAMQHNVQIEELEEWILNEEKRFISLGLLKPNEKLTNWQEVERRYLERITQEQYHSTEQLEQRLRQDRELLEKLARDYQIQVEEIEDWMKKELDRLRDEGQLQIKNLTAWQIAEREHIEELIKQNKQWSLVELENILKQDREHLQKTAFQYHTSVEEIEEWLKKELAKMQQQGQINIQQLTAWQKEQQRRIFSLLQQQSSITAEDFEKKVAQDRNFLMNLAHQYRVSVDEIEAYVKKVIDDLREKGKFEIENLKAWQVAERDYIKQFISQHKNTLSTEDYERKLLQDRLHLNQLADHYRINVADIEEWMIKELKRLRQDTDQHIQNLAAWQASELVRLQQLIQENNQLNYVQFEVELKKERDRLLELSKQYSISVEEIEQWLREQLLNLKTIGHVQVESLSKWQEDEQKRLIVMCLEKQKEISTAEFQEQLRKDRTRLEQLARDHNLSVGKLEQWMSSELQRLQNSGLVQVQQLSQWQRSERERLEQWLKQQHREITSDELEAFIKRDKQRLQQIAQDYHVTAEEIESWVQQESARLKLLGVVKPGTQYSYEQHEYQDTRHQSASNGYRPTNWQSVNNGQQIVSNERPIQTQYTFREPRPATTQQKWESSINRPVISAPQDETWKIQTQAHLKAMMEGRQWTRTDLEQFLRRERPRWRQYSRQYNIPITDIEQWLRQSVQGLIQPDQFNPTNINNNYNNNNNQKLEEWKLIEQRHIQNLIDNKIRKQQKWSIEELQRYLHNDYEHLQKVANAYHLPIDEIENWYKEDLNYLLQNRRIYTENLNDWQRLQKDQLYNIVSRQPGKSLQQWEQQILINDRDNLQRFAYENQVSRDELEKWMRQELRRLMNLGFITNVPSFQSGLSSRNQWHEDERQRLREIATQMKLTEDEFLDFIGRDSNFQQELARTYGCGLEQLAPFQRIEINKMQREGLLDRSKLLAVEPWQQSERDRLYGFIKDKSGYNLEDLQNWQKQDTFVNGLAARYGITSATLKDWQTNELERLQNVAAYYQMNLNQMQSFREKEMRLMDYIMHQRSSSDQEKAAWTQNEARRMNILERKSGLNGDDLMKWRRQYYLLCQGRLPFEAVTGERVASNYRIHSPRHISKDRGDQPPNMHDELLETASEPGLAEELHQLPATKTGDTSRRRKQRYGTP